MAREEFIDNLRHASRLLAPQSVSGDRGAHGNGHLASMLDSADLWLTPKVVGGFDPSDFADWPKAESILLEKEVAAFKAIAQEVGPSERATKSQSKLARRHLERAIAIVRDRLLPEWLEAQNTLMEEAAAAAKAKGWHVEFDEKEVLESLLGTYKAPRLRIKSLDREVVLNPIACFGSGRQGVVDLVVLPTYETAYLIAFKGGQWQIVSLGRTAHRRPFNQKTLIHTITTLPRH